ncbi:hypothetical protein [Sphingopyxis sp. KK2]|uniref:hypothetical protein n=1 Tax=Sphingopyxis sp. KK2 TaxID=1855727 RepID=UPI00097E60FF|nr:hypothetical protein [Sphingopyxis sp. KK2]
MIARVAGGLWTAAVLAFCPSLAQAEDKPSAEAIVARTKAPASGYSLFHWTISRQENRVYSFWAAEFHRGSLHRVETPLDRIVADCKAMTGHHRSLISGKTLSSREAAETACGIDMTGAPALTYAGRLSSPYGDLDVVMLTKDGLRRLYWVDPAGLLIQSEFRGDNDQPGQPKLRNWTTEVSRTSPDTAMFTPESLDRSFVPLERQVDMAPEHFALFEEPE